MSVIVGPTKPDDGNSHDHGYGFDGGQGFNGGQGFDGGQGFNGDHGHDHDHDHHHDHHHEHCVCYLTGTRIATPTGDINIEDLRPGDHVMTADGRASPVRWLGRQTVQRAFAPDTSLPVRIKAGAFDEAIPSRDLLVSHQHAIFIDDVLVEAGALINGTTVVRMHDVAERFTFYHVELDEHALILAENTPAESFVDNVSRTRFDNWQEHEALYPADRSIAEMPYPRAKSARQVPAAVRARLAKRAVELAGAAALSAA